MGEDCESGGEGGPADETHGTYSTAERKGGGGDNTRYSSVLIFFFAYQFKLFPPREVKGIGVAEKCHTAPYYSKYNDEKDYLYDCCCRYGNDSNGATP